MYWLALIGPAVPIIGCLYVFYKILSKNIDGVKGDLTKTIDDVKDDLTKTIDDVKSDLRTNNKSISDVREKLSGIDATLKGMKENMTLHVEHYWSKPPYSSRNVKEE